MEYNRTKDILHVMRFLAHRSIANTLRYTQLVEFGAEDQYHVKVARTLKESVRTRQIWLRVLHRD